MGSRLVEGEKKTGDGGATVEATAKTGDVRGTMLHGSAPTLSFESSLRGHEGWFAMIDFHVQTHHLIVALLGMLDEDSDGSHAKDAHGGKHGKAGKGKSGGKNDHGDGTGMDHLQQDRPPHMFEEHVALGKAKTATAVAMQVGPMARSAGGGALGPRGGYGLSIASSGGVHASMAQFR
jgi:hypothetical protein